MKLPWVSRDTHAQAQTAASLWEQAARLNEANAKQALDQAQRWQALYEASQASRESDMVRAEARYADLMSSYRMLRMKGFEPPPPEQVVGPVAPVDIVLAAVNAHAPDAKTRKMMLRQVEIDRGMQLTDVEIIQRIQRGNRPAEEIA